MRVMNINVAFFLYKIKKFIKKKLETEICINVGKELTVAYGFFYNFIFMVDFILLCAQKGTRKIAILKHGGVIIKILLFASFFSRRHVTEAKCA